jgi:hypothetical protein
VTQLPVNFAGISIKAVFSGSGTALQRPGCRVFELLVMGINSSLSGFTSHIQESKTEVKRGLYEDFVGYLKTLSVTQAISVQRYEKKSSPITGLNWPRGWVEV